MRDPRTARRPRGPGNRWELIWSHRDELLEIARSRSSSAEEAEDAVQEAMIRAVEDPAVQYGRVRSWLKIATARACADRHRQVARDSALSESLSAAPVEPFLVEEVVCDRAEARWLADRSAELLPARQAEALRLHSQGLDVGQVARTLGLSYRATESLLARARRSLRNALAGSLTLAMTVWMCARRFPRTGVAQSAVATSAAVTVAVVGLVLPAGSPDRPDGRLGGSSEDTVSRAASAAEFPAPRVTPEHPHAPSPSPDPCRIDRAGQNTSRPISRKPTGAAAVEVPIGSGALAPVMPSAATHTSIPPLPVGASGIHSPKAPSVPSDISGLAAPDERPRQGRRDPGPTRPDHGR
ncbi:sigma-70 family RNA polymerase sigma factor [Streptomyces sp. NPDC005480]|uniref:sigma-70 family RNA polymerase sigma factor n=1 Tax=Streptomyces sp. NPDC005480 TaxID=3154880 RepID=UPI0033A10B5D